MSFTDGKPWIATEEDCRKRWCAQPSGAAFRCALCGHKFKPGDVVRWQFTNDIPNAGGNPLVCHGCDVGKDGIVAEIIKRRDELLQAKYWWFK